MPELQGRRVQVAEETWPPDIRGFEPGDYAVIHPPWGDRERELWFKDPLGHVGRTSSHALTENEDGTVTVDPSILDDKEGQGERFHGWLRGGVWSW